MRKSGLQKQISFIFEDVPIPPTNTDGKPLMPLQSETPAAPSAAPMPTLQTAAASHSGSQPKTADAVRPRPLPRKQFQPVRSQSGQQFGRQLQKLLGGSTSGGMDPRQKKMTIMVAVLAVVFTGVLTVSLGGLGQTTAKSVKPAEISAAPKAASAKLQPQWQMPEPLPAELRNPMAPRTQETESQEADGDASRLVVKGIVFSRSKPSAIIGEKIVFPGETIGGAVIVAITRENVEFEQDGRRWTQQVER